MTLQDKIDLEKLESFNEGKSEGIEIGEARGREEGIEIGEARGREEGIELGEARGMESILFAMLADGEITISAAARRLNITEEEFEQKYQEYQTNMQ